MSDESTRTILASKLSESGGKLRVRSALNPILWLCALVTLPAIICLSFSEKQPVWLICLGIAPVIVALFGFVFLLFSDRDKLQSEDYQIRKQSLELIEQKGDLRPVAFQSIELIANPKIPSGHIADGGER